MRAAAPRVACLIWSLDHIIAITVTGIVREYIAKIDDIFTRQHQEDAGSTKIACTRNDSGKPEIVPTIKPGCQHTALRRVVWIALFALAMDQHLLWQTSLAKRGCLWNAEGEALIMCAPKRDSSQSVTSYQAG